MLEIVETTSSMHERICPEKMLHYSSISIQGNVQWQLAEGLLHLTKHVSKHSPKKITQINAVSFWDAFGMYLDT